MSPITGGGGGGAQYEPYSNAENIQYSVLVGDSAFSAKINGAVAGDTLAYDTVVGNDLCIVTQSTGEIGKFVLHNTTRGEEALIKSASPAFMSITVTDADDIAAWEDNDNIQCNSLTAIDPGGPPYFFDIDMSGVLAAGCDLIGVHMSVADTGLGAGAWTHPYESYGAAKLFGITNAVVSKWAVLGTLLVPIASQRFCLQWNASGAATFYAALRIMGKRE